LFLIINNFRSFHGLFSSPVFLFPRKCSPATNSDLSIFSPLVLPGDQLSEQVTIKGTTYRAGYVIVTKVFSSEVLEVGTILKILFRKNAVMFLVNLSEAVRNRLGFFETLPLNIVSLAHYQKLGDYKPLIKRSDNSCYSFVLHHHIVSPPVDDDLPSV
jgi:hypothetical protein